MTKRTISLIIFLGAITLILIYLAIVPQINHPQPAALRIPPTQTSVAHTTLSFSPDTLTTSSASGSFDILIDTGKDNVSAVQIELLYDPKAIKNVVLTPQPFFQNQKVIFSYSQPKEGRITLVIGAGKSQNAKSGVGKIATLSFQGTGQIKQTTISFLPKTMVTALRVSPSVLRSTNYAKIIFNEAVTLPAVTK